MPLQNRVTPFGAIIADPARGTLMGNRGSLHDRQQRPLRQYQVTRWIICLTAFKGRRRPLMASGQYTELFFLDEATHDLEIRRRVRAGPCTNHESSMSSRARAIRAS